MNSGKENSLDERSLHRAPRVITATTTLNPEDFNFVVALPAGAIVITLPPLGDDKAINRKYRGVVISTAGGSATLVGGADASSFTSASVADVGDCLSAENFLGRAWD